MCKAGGPRCPETPGKKARVRFNRKIDQLAKSDGSAKDSWKTQNAAEYDALLVETFANHQTEDPLENDLSWLNYREIAEEVQQQEYVDDLENSAEPLDEYDQALLEDMHDLEDEFDDDIISENPEDVQAFLNRHGYSFPSEISEEESAEQLGAWDEVDVGGAETGDAENSEPEPVIAIRKNYVPTTNRHRLPENAEISSPTPSPVFVYGTLRSGQGNYRGVLEGRVTRAQEGSLPGASMYSNGGFPYVIEDEGEGVKGELMYLDYDQIVDTMDSLDSLEGTRELTNDYNLYNRYLRYVHVGDNKYVQAWVYMPPESRYDSVQNLPKIEDGDWVEHRSFRR